MAGLFDLPDGRMPRREAEDIIRAGHYLKSFPSGWAYSYIYQGAVVVFSIPANKNLGTYLFAGTVEVRELARLWAPDGHRANLLTEAMSFACRALRADTNCEAVVSFADPNQGHHGGVYQAASWIYTGQSEETRVYITPDGRTLSRRSFHSGGTSIIPNIKPQRLEGKHRYVRCLTKTSKVLLRRESRPYPKPRPIDLSKTVDDQMSVNYG